MSVNDIAQWGVLVFMAIFLLGLTRQLGHFLMSNREQRAAEGGPVTGKHVPSAWLAGGEATRLREFMYSRGADWAVLVALHENCKTCDSLLTGVERGRAEIPVLGMLSGESSPRYRDRLTSIADLVVTDEERLQSANLNVTPFIVFVDQDLKVRHKAVGTHLAGAVVEYRYLQGTDSDARKDPTANGEVPDGRSQSLAIHQGGQS